MRILPFVLTEESRKGIYINNNPKPIPLNIVTISLPIVDGIQVMNQQTGTIQINRIISRVPGCRNHKRYDLQVWNLLQEAAQVWIQIGSKKLDPCTTDNNNEHLPERNYPQPFLNSHVMAIMYKNVLQQ